MPARLGAAFVLALTAALALACGGGDAAPEATPAPATPRATATAPAPATPAATAAAPAPATPAATATVSMLGEVLEETADGLRVTGVLPGSPAEAAGLRAGDVLLAVAGREVATFADVEELARGLPPPPDGALEVEVRRGGERLTLRASLPARGAAGGGLPTR